jgi:hypothetical protein
MWCFLGALYCRSANQKGTVLEFYAGPYHATFAMCVLLSCVQALALGESQQRSLEIKGCKSDDAPIMLFEQVVFGGCIAVSSTIDLDFHSSQVVLLNVMEGTSAVRDYACEDRSSHTNFLATFRGDIDNRLSSYRCAASRIHISTRPSRLYRNRAGLVPR